MSKIFGEIKIVRSRRLCFKHRKQKYLVSAFQTQTQTQKPIISLKKIHLAIEGNVMAELGDGLTKSHVIKDKTLSRARIPDTYVFVFETQKLLVCAGL